MRDTQILPAPIMPNTQRMLTKYLQSLGSEPTHLHIKIHNSEVPITVQTKGPSGELDYCNHAGALLDLVDSDVSDNPQRVLVRVCDKPNCSSVQNSLGIWS